MMKRGAGYSLRELALIEVFMRFDVAVRYHIVYVSKNNRDSFIDSK